MSKLTTGIITTLIMLVAIYVFIAIVTFRFRHPWATDTERLIYIIEALQFEKIPYNNMRPREEL